MGFQICKIFNVYNSFGILISRFSNKSFVKPRDWKVKKILLLKKITRYEFNKITHKDLSEHQLMEYLRKTGSDYDGLLVRHSAHYDKMNQLIKYLNENEMDVRLIDRFSYNQSNIDWADLIITAGGDGTFLLGASRIKDQQKPILGINTDPVSSEGYLCLGRRHSSGLQLQETLRRILLDGEFNWLLRQRIQVGLSGLPANYQRGDDGMMELHDLELNSPEYRFLEHIGEAEVTQLDRQTTQSSAADMFWLPYPALNEVFIGESLSARVSYYEISIDDSPSQKQKSSGVTVSTGTGSSSWSFHISHISEDCVANILQLCADEMSLEYNNRMLGDKQLSTSSSSSLASTIARRYNSRLCFNPEENRMAYTIRDPIRNKIFQVSHPRGFATKMKIKSRMWDAHVVVDGGISYKFNDGSIAHMYIDPNKALRCISI